VYVPEFQGERIQISTTAGISSAKYLIQQAAQVLSGPALAWQLTNMAISMTERGNFTALSTQRQWTVYYVWQ